MNKSFKDFSTTSELNSHFQCKINHFDLSWSEYRFSFVSFGIGGKCLLTRFNNFNPNLDLTMMLKGGDEPNDLSGS